MIWGFDYLTTHILSIHLVVGCENLTLDAMVQVHDAHYITRTGFTRYNIKHSDKTIIQPVAEKPSIEQIISDIASTKSFVALGRKYGVSDSAVHKWVRRYRYDPKMII